MRQATGQLLILLIFLAAAGIIFSSSLSYPFVWDDTEVVENNHYLRRAGGWGLFFRPEFWTEMLPISRADYRPVQMLALKIISRGAGGSPFLFRLLNILLHLVVSFLVWLLGRRIFPRSLVPLLAAALFAFHPIHVEVAVNIRNIAELLAAGLMLAALLVFTSDREPTLTIPVSAAIFLTALLCKESALLFPLILTAFVLCVPSNNRRKILLQRTLPFWMIAIPAGLGKILIARGAGNPPPTIIQALTASAKMPLYYLRLLFFPLRLRVLYPFGNAADWSGPQWFFSLLALPSLILAIAAWRRKQRVILWLLISLGLTILPLLSKVGQIGRLIAEQRLYFPSVFFCLLAAGIFARLLSRNRKRTSAAILLLFAILLLSWAVLTAEYLAAWKSSEILWNRVKKLSPRAALAFNNLAIIYHHRGDKEAARREWEEAIRLVPNHPEAHNNLGVFYRSAGRWQEAIHHFERSLKSNPEYDAAALNLAELYLRRRKTDKAEELIRQVMERTRYDARVYNGLGVVLEQKGDYRGALEAYLKSARLNPERAESLRNLVDFFRKSGDSRKAIEAGREAIRRRPSNPAGYLVLARVYVARGEFFEARRLLQKAARLDPDNRRIKARLWALPSTGD